MGSVCSSPAATSVHNATSPYHSAVSSRRYHGNSGLEDSSTLSNSDSERSLSPPLDIYPSSPTVVSVAPPVMHRPAPTDPKLPSLGEFPPGVRKMLAGRMDAGVSLKNKVITLCHVSSFTDSRFERCHLYQRVYPRLQNYCAAQGFILRVVDTYLGMRDENQFGHSVPAFSLRLLQQLAQEDKHLITTVFLNEKYGVYWCPPSIAADDFANVLKKVTDDDKTFLLQWYTSAPTRTDRSYVLQPVESVIPKYRSKYPEGYREWEKVVIRIKNILSQAASPEFQKKYFISNIENLLNGSVLSDNYNTENVVWLRRIFTNMFLTAASNSDFVYVDTVRDRIVEFAQNRLKNLVSQLHKLVPPQNCVHSEVKWVPEGLDTSNVEHGDYIKALCNSYEEILKRLINGVIAEKKQQDCLETKMLHRGFTPCLYNDLLHTTVLCQERCATLPPGGRKCVMPALEEYLRSGYIAPDVSLTQPLVLSGPPGSGLTATVSALAAGACSVECWTGSVCVARLGGGHSDTWEALLEGIVRQLCILAQICHKEAKSQGLGGSLSWIFTKWSPVTPLLVIIDGMEGLVPGDLGVDWVPTNLPGHVRMCITACATTGSEWFTGLQRRFPGGDNFVEVPPLEDVELMEILDTWMGRTCCRLPDTTVTDVIAKLGAQVTPLTAHLAAAVLATSELRHSVTNGNRTLGLTGSAPELVSLLAERLEGAFGAEVTEGVLTIISCTRDGVSDVEMEEMLSCRTEYMQAACRDCAPESERFPPYLWLLLKDFLRPFLLQKSIGGIPVVTWSHDVIRDVIIARYTRNRKQTVLHVLNYFDGHFSIGSTNWTFPQCVRLGNASYNIRKLHETPHLLTLTRDASRLLTKCIFDWDWFSAKLSSSNFSRLLSDLSLAVMIAPADPNVQPMAKIMHLLRHHWIETPKQFSQYLVILVHTGQVTIDRGKHPLLHKFYTEAARAAGEMLWPADRSCLREWDSRSPDTVTGVFRIPTEPAYVITAAMDAGTVKVINVFTQDVVRTIHGLDQPKNAKMCANFRAVVLCNRELVVLDVDHGTLLARLKGVLNIKMPYFGVHDHLNTIALARNRMYVNMMNNISGDLVTTFKVGEDRFLDSLLVSRNGNICVCGDAVQKPFPLLVWDLHSRKLIYDLRIQGHEFLTRMADITHAGQFVVCVSRELDDPDPNSIIVYDLQSGSVFKKWRPEYSVTSVAISGSSSLVISGHEDGSVCVWDLVGGAQKYRFTGHTKGPDRLSVCEKGERVASYDSTGRDTTVFIWDLKTGESLGGFVSLSGVSSCEISGDGSLLVVGLPGCPDVTVIRLPGEEDLEAACLLFGDPIRAGETFHVTS